MVFREIVFDVVESKAVVEAVILWMGLRVFFGVAEVQFANQAGGFMFDSELRRLPCVETFGFHLLA